MSDWHNLGEALGKIGGTCGTAKLLTLGLRSEVRDEGLGSTVPRGGGDMMGTCRQSPKALT